MEIVTNLLVILSEGIPGMVMAALALLIMFFALIRKDAGLMVIAAFFTVPVTYVVGGWTGVLLLVRLMPLFQLLSAVALSWDEPLFAWILPLPTFGYLIYFLFNLIVSNAREF